MRTVLVIGVAALALLLLYFISLSNEPRPTSSA